jgi:hypothetical protein
MEPKREAYRNGDMVAGRSEVGADITVMGTRMFTESLFEIM